MVMISMSVVTSSGRSTIVAISSGTGREGIGAIVAMMAIVSASSTIVTMSAIETTRSAMVTGSAMATGIFTSRCVSSANGVVNVEHDFSADGKIEESSGISSEKFNSSRNFSAGKEDELNTVSVASKSSIVIGNPDDLESFNNRNDIRGLLATKGDRTRVGKTLEIDDFQSGSNEETGFGDNELEGCVASGDGRIVSRVELTPWLSTDLRSTGDEAEEISVDDGNNGKVNLI